MVRGARSPLERPGLRSSSSGSRSSTISTYLRLARQQQERVVEIPAPRGSIFDRNGQPLAMSVPVDSVSVNPRRVPDLEVAAEILSGILELDRTTLYGRLRMAADNGRGFLWVKRKITPEQSRRLRSLQLDWIEFQQESQRYYPKGTAGREPARLGGSRGERQRRHRSRARRRSGRAPRHRAHADRRQAPRHRLAPRYRSPRRHAAHPHHRRAHPVRRRTRDRRGRPGAQRQSRQRGGHESVQRARFSPWPATPPSTPTSRPKPGEPPNAASTTRSRCPSSRARSSR